MDWIRYVPALTAACSIAALGVSIVALLRTTGVHRSTRTNQLLERFSSESFRLANRWVISHLSDFIETNDINTTRGFGTLDRGGRIVLKWADNSTKEVLPSSIAREVADFYETIAREVRRNTVDRSTILAVMSHDITLAWGALGPVINRISARYYSTKRMTDFGMLAEFVDRKSTTKNRLAVVTYFWDAPKPWHFKPPAVLRSLFNRKRRSRRRAR